MPDHTEGVQGPWGEEQQRTNDPSRTAASAEPCNQKGCGALDQDIDNGHGVQCRNADQYQQMRQERQEASQAILAVEVECIGEVRIPCDQDPDGLIRIDHRSVKRLEKPNTTSRDQQQDRKKEEIPLQTGSGDHFTALFRGASQERLPERPEPLPWPLRSLLR